MTAPLLDNRVAVVTGAGQGIGREIARVLSEHREVGGGRYI